MNIVSRYFHKRKIKKLKIKYLNLMEELVNIKSSLEKNNFTDDNLKLLNNIIIESSITLDKSLIKDNTIKVSLFTKSCYKGLKLYLKGIIHNDILAKESNSISLTKKEMYFVDWYDGKEALLDYDNFIKKSIKLYLAESELDFYNTEMEVIDIELSDFLESILFRYMVLDYLEIFILCFRGEYERRFKNED